MEYMGGLFTLAAAIWTFENNIAIDNTDELGQIY